MKSLLPRNHTTLWPVLIGLALSAGAMPSAIAAATAPLSAGLRRAVLVGIDNYRFASDAELASARPALEAAHMLAAGEQPPARDWQPLDGAVNDLHAMHELLVHRYAFKAENLIELPNEAATRQHILDALEKSFIQDARDGDVLFFFYSGHGSQMRNSRSATKGDKIDETLVPWDANVGFFDIRDKELARLFNRALSAHHVTLTAVFDSCHSGSITRGLIRHRSKNEPEDTRDAADPYHDTPPESRGALILSAAQFDEPALEAIDTSVSPEQPRGAFALSLMQAMENSDPATPAIEVFRAARSRLHTLGSEYSQEPVISANAERLRRGLFGDAPGNASPVSVLVTAVDAERGAVTIDAGFAIGLAAGARLRPRSGGGNELEISAVEGFNQSQAVIRAGAASDIRVNDVYQLSSWAVPAQAPLSLWWPASGLPLERLHALARRLEPLTHGAFHWVTDPSVVSPTHFLEWSGSQWLLHGPAGEREVSGKDGLPDVGQVAAQLQTADRLLVLIPWPQEWASALQGLPGSVAAASDRNQATYWLTGTFNGATIAYAWTQPMAALTPASSLTLPSRTDWVASSDPAAGAPLRDYASKLGAVAALLKLPESGDSDPFPYHLLLRSAEGGAEISGTELQSSAAPGAAEQRALKTAQLSGGEVYDLVLKADAASLANFNQRNPEGRWVYVFAVDSSGQRDPLFVYSDQRARFPRSYPPALDDPEKLTCRAKSYPTAEPLDEICIGTIRVCPSYGVDTYFLLATDHPIPDLSVFAGAGVRTEGISRGQNSPLADLLSGTAGVGSTRGAVPERFSIERLTVLSSGRADIAACKE